MRFSEPMKIDAAIRLDMKDSRTLVATNAAACERLATAGWLQWKVN